MKLLVLHSQLGVLRGGGENFTRNVVAVLVKRGWQVSVVFGTPLSGRCLVALPDGAEPIPIRGWWEQRPGQRTLSAIVRRFRRESRAARLCERVKDALGWRGMRWHQHRFQKRVERTLASRWAEFDAVYVHHDVRLAVETSRHLPTILRLPGPVSSDKAILLEQVPVVCANGDALEQTRTLIGDRAVELPIGIDHRAFSPGATDVRDHLGWNATHMVLGYVGQFTRLKGVDLLAEAFCKLTMLSPEARLIIIGHGEEGRRISGILAGEIASGRAHIVGGLNSSELARWYRAMDGFVLPSRYENFSNSLLEACACGIPFLASDVGGNRLFEDIGAGLFFEPDSVADLVRCMSEFSADHREIAVRARERTGEVGKRYNWLATADRFESILEENFNLWAGTSPDAHRGPGVVPRQGVRGVVR